MVLPYDEAIDYLYSLINYEVQRPERYTPDVISLERPRALMAALGDPQEKYPVIHVTGTKGKGSVSAMCASILQAAGLRVGLYSSPHLQDFRERFRINGDLIERDVLASLVERIRPVVAKTPGLTWFEVVTAIGFLYFAEAKVDIAVIEVGLGGRLDATNILRAPLVSCITSLSYDHMHLLGNTLHEIAFEKGGIIKPGVPVVSAPQPPEALQVLEKIAGERGAPLTLVGRDYEFASEKADVYGQWFTANPHGKADQRYWTPLLGQHQVINAAVALAALDHVRKRIQRITIEDKALVNGLRWVNWPGRLEIAGKSPWIVLDVAHNAASAERLIDTVRNIFALRRLILIFGAFTDKDVAGMFKALLPATTYLIVMQAINPRAFSTDQLVQMAREAGYNGEMEARPSASEALHQAQELAEAEDMILVTGSLSVVGEMRTVLGLTPARAKYLDEVTVQNLQNAPALLGGE